MIGFFEYQYLKYKKNHLSNLVALAKVDGHLDKTEIKFLHEIGEKYGLKKHQIDDILASEPNSKMAIAENYYQKIGQLFDVVGMMMADEVIHDKEMRFCEEMCKRMKLKPALIKEMVELYKKGGVQDFEEWEKFVEVSKKYKIEK